MKLRLVYCDDGIFAPSTLFAETNAKPRAGYPGIPVFIIVNHLAIIAPGLFKSSPSRALCVCSQGISITGIRFLSTDSHSPAPESNPLSTLTGRPPKIPASMHANSHRLWNLPPSAAGLNDSQLTTDSAGNYYTIKSIIRGVFGLFVLDRIFIRFENTLSLLPAQAGFHCLG